MPESVLIEKIEDCPDYAKPLFEYLNRKQKYMPPKKQPLTPEEVKTAIDSLDLENQLALFFYLKTIIDDKQKYIADQLKKIEDTNARMNGKV